MADDIIPLRHSYALSMVERISELEAEVERLRNAGDALAHLMPHAHLSVPCRPPRRSSLNEWCSECAALVAWKEACNAG